jgi:hypothetical protein
MSNDKLGLSIFVLSIFAFCMAFVFGPAVMEGHVVLAFLCLSMFGMYAGAQLLGDAQ